MASPLLFSDIPPFPEDVPTVDISCISLTGLNEGNDEDNRKLREASQELGFFLIDLKGDPVGDIVIDEITEIWSMMIAMMNLPDDIKAKYPFDHSNLLGYKFNGQFKTETKQPDRVAYWNFAQDALLGNTPRPPYPDLVNNHMTLLSSFIQNSHKIISLILSRLATQLSLPPSAFTNLQRPTHESGSVMRFIKSSASLKDEDLRSSLMHHTDFGTITFLVNVLGGLQILSPGHEPSSVDGWKFVRPRPNCIIINLGDAMKQWTGGVLKSNIHRIFHPPGQQRYLDKYSFALLVRPEKNASMKCLVGDNSSDGAEEDEEIGAWEWEKRRAEVMVKGSTAAYSKGGKFVTVE